MGLKNSNIILADFPVTSDWHFLKALENFSGKHFSVKWIDGTAGVSRMARIVKYFLFPIKTFLKRNSYQNIICWQQFFGIMIAFYCKVFRVKKGPKLSVMTFIYKSKEGAIGKIYKKWVKYSVNSKYVDHIVVYSKHEIELYHKELEIPLDKLFYIPLSIPEAPEMNDDEVLLAENYIFSPGKSNRDFDFLVNALLSESYNVHIACDDYPAVDAPNITVHHNLFNEGMYHYMHNCRCVVIPLKDLNISSGQLVVLQAMQIKKPIIITKSNAITDYVKNDFNALVINNTKSELLKALHSIYNDDKLCARLTNNGFQQYCDRHTENAMGKAMAQIINS